MPPVGGIPGGLGSHTGSLLRLTTCTQVGMSNRYTLPGAPLHWGIQKTELNTASTAQPRTATEGTRRAAGGTERVEDADADGTAPGDALR